jgi:MFS family permease
MNGSNKSLKTIVAICIGNAMEWYDFMIYNFMLLFIAQAYFPVQNRVNSLLLTMASSGVAFIARPIGGILLGAWADRHGHHKALMLVFNLMALATVLITFTPKFSQIGILATVLIVGARLIQGLATGGEFGIASALLVSLAPEQKKGLYTSFQMVGQLLAVLLGSTICFFLTINYSKEILFDYAWRIPFALGLLIVPIGWLLRRQLQHQIDWNRKPIRTLNLVVIVKQQKNSLLQALGLIIGCTASMYTLFSYMPTFSKLYLYLPMQYSYLGPMVGISISIITIPFFGALSDKIGKRSILVPSLIFYFIFIYPLLSWLNYYPSLSMLILVESIFGLFIGAYFGVTTVIVSELFPKEIRSTCLAISYNLAVMLFGGFAPLVITALIEKSGNPMIFTYYLMTAIFISLVSALCYQEHSLRPDSVRSTIRSC